MKMRKGKRIIKLVSGYLEEKGYLPIENRETTVMFENKELKRYITFECGLISVEASCHGEDFGYFVLKEIKTEWYFKEWLFQDADEFEDIIVKILKIIDEYFFYIIENTKKPIVKNKIEYTDMLMYNYEERMKRFSLDHNLDLDYSGNNVKRAIELIEAKRKNTRVDQINVFDENLEFFLDVSSYIGELIRKRWDGKWCIEPYENNDREPIRFYENNQAPSRNPLDIVIDHWNFYPYLECRGIEFSIVKLSKAIDFIRKWI